MVRMTMDCGTKMAVMASLARSSLAWRVSLGFISPPPILDIHTFGLGVRVPIEPGLHFLQDVPGAYQFAIAFDEVNAVAVVREPSQARDFHEPRAVDIRWDHDVGETAGRGFAPEQGEVPSRYHAEDRDARQGRGCTGHANILRCQQ